MSRPDFLGSDQRIEFVGGASAATLLGLHAISKSEGYGPGEVGVTLLATMGRLHGMASSSTPKTAEQAWSEFTSEHAKKVFVHFFNDEKAR